MKRFLLAFFLFFYSCGFSQTITPLYYSNYMRWHFKRMAWDKCRILYVCCMTKSILTPNNQFHNQQRNVALSNLFEKKGINFIEIVDGWIRHTSNNFHKPGFCSTLPIDSSASHTDWIFQNDFAATFQSTGKRFSDQNLKDFLNHSDVDT